MKKSILNVKVHPRAKRGGVEKIEKNTYKVRVQAPPEKGAANKEVIAALADYLELPPSALKIIRGEKSRTKLIQVER